MMWVCDYNHNPICYDAMKCPMCEITEQAMNFTEKDELENEVVSLQAEVENLEEENQELEDKVKELEAQLEDLQNETRKVG